MINNYLFKLIGVLMKFQFSSTHVNMASTQFLFCGPCENRKSHRQANVWCSVCLEGLCKECEQLHTSSKLSKGHTTFDVNHYPLLKPFLKNLQLDCEEHHKRYDFYCQDHSTLC
jgi:hypothetical protein